MKKVTLKIPAKLNLTLDVTGENGGYHNLNSLVTSISLYDTIIVKKRKDKQIHIIERGIKCGCKETDNNAYKTAKLFMEEFDVLGVDIIIDKYIPIANGLGGSSADIVGVLKGMKELYGIKKDVTFLAEKLGSDTSYMMKGGLAVMSGRGENITPLDVDIKLYILLISSDKQISAGGCFREFDKVTEPPKTCTDKAVELLKEKKIALFLSALKNDLFIPAITFVPELEKTIYDLNCTGAKKSLMTGSGSCCYGIFLDKKSMNKAVRELKKEYSKFIIKTETV